MGSPEPEGSKLLASDILTLSDSDLDQALRRYLPAENNATILVSVDGWDALSRPDQMAAAQRLKDRIQTFKSRPVDLDQVAARLRQVGASASTARLPRRPPSPSPSLSRSPTPPLPPEPDYETMMGEWTAEAIIIEKASYKKLVADGGRPWYPLHMIEHVVMKPKEHPHELRYWGYRAQIDVFDQQLWRWEHFRDWQRDNRGIFDLQADFARKQEATRQYYKLKGQDSAELSTDEWRQETLKRLEYKRAIAHRYEVEHGVAVQSGTARFPVYVEAVKARLAQHNFARAFELQQNPLHQTKLTTWAEYLNYEYWTYDTFVRKAERVRQQHDDGLKVLLAANVLRPDETPDIAMDFDVMMKLSLDEATAEKVRLAAEAGLEMAQEALRRTKQASDRHAKEELVKWRQTRLQSAAENAAACKRRYQSLLDFRGAGIEYTMKIEEVKRHEILLQWILEQVPLVEAETMAETTPATESSRKRKRGGEDRDDVVAPVAEPKRRKAPAQTVAVDTSTPKRSRAGTGRVSVADKPAPAVSRTGRRRAVGKNAAGITHQADTSHRSSRLSKRNPAVNEAKSPAPRRRSTTPTASLVPPSERTTPPLRRSARIAASHGP